MPREKPNLENMLSIYYKNVNIKSLTEEEIEKYNANFRITILCPKGHEYKYSVTKIKSENVDVTICPHCLKEEKYNEKRISNETFINYCNKYNLDFLPKQEYYKKWDDHITFICKKCGNKKDIRSLYRWDKNKPFKCIQCEREEIKNSNNIELGILVNKEMNEKIDNICLNKNIEYITLHKKVDYSILPEKLRKNLEKQNKWILIKYHNTKNKCIYQCTDCGEFKHTMPYNIFSGRGFGCNSCSYSKKLNNVSYKIKDLLNRSNDIYLYEIPNDFNSLNLLKFKCNKCGLIFERQWNHINAYGKLPCPQCHKSTKRKSQNDVYEWICSQYDGNVIQEDRSNGFEIDIYIPELKIGIEYCGLVWHSTKYKTNPSVHKDKLNKCNKLGIRLITMFEDEWKSKTNISKSRILNILGKSKRIFARKCDLTEIDNSTALTFCKENHIQGSGQCHCGYGLYYENELMSVMTFSKPSVSKSGKNYDWELNRFCSKLNYNIVGGASRLMKKFKNDHKNEILITFCDLRWGTGNVYEKLGFEYVYTTRPNYYYFGQMTDYKRKHRFNFTKQKLLKLFPSYNESMTEEEIAKENGLFRIYDCGHLKYKMIIV